MPGEATDSRRRDRLLEGVVADSRIDLRRGDVPVPEGALDEVQVAGLAVQPGGERGERRISSPR